MKTKIIAVTWFVRMFGVCLFFSFNQLYAQTWTTIDGGGTYGISSTTSSNSNYPSVAVFNGELYAIWQEYTGSAYEIHVKKYDGSSWTTAGVSAGSSLLYSNSYSLTYPKLVYYNNALYAAWSGIDAGIYVVHVIKYNGSTWTYTQDYTVGEGRSNVNNVISFNAQRIDIAVFNSELYAIWVEQDHANNGIYNVRVSKFDGTIWTSVDGNGNYGINYNTTYHAYHPKLCVFNNALYAAWKESNSSGISQLRVRRYDGSSTWTFIDGNGANGLNYSTSTTLGDEPLSLSSYNGKMYAFWTESLKVRVKQYDATNGWTTDPDGGSGWYHNTTTYSGYPHSFQYNNLLYATWEQNPVPRQVRVVSFDGTTKTFIDGDVASVGINNTSTNRGHFPKLVGYKGDLMAVWSEELTSTSGSANQIRAKKYPLPPFVDSVSVPSDGTYIAGQTLTFTVTYSKDVVISGGTPYIPITLNTGGTVNATYVSGSGSSTLTFSYTIVSGNEDTDGISVGTAISNGGATLQSEDSTPLTANLTLYNIGSTTGVLVDAIAPTVSSVTSTNADGIYSSGNSIAITITFSEAITVTGTPTLALNSGGTAYYSSGSGSTVLTFTYTVGSGESSSDLNYSSTSSLSLAGGTIKDAVGNSATLTLPTVGGSSSLGGQKDIVIGAAPTVTTQEVSDITTTTATGNGNITGLGTTLSVTAYGVCWSSTNATPTTSDNMVDNGAASATGAFIASITGLTPNTTYYVRAYATNASGTAYGDTVLFTTESAGIPDNLTVADTTVTASSEACFDAQNEIIVAGSSEVIVEEDASANFIAGYSVTLLPGFHAVEGSYVHAWITEDGSFCDALASSGSAVATSTGKSQIIDELVEPTEKTIAEKSIKVYPNPNNGVFTLELGNVDSGSSVCLYNLMGAVVYRSVTSSETALRINLPGIKKGIYFVKVADNDKQLTKKIVVD